MNLRKGLLLALFAAGVIGLFAWYKGPPPPTQASTGTPLDDQVLYGIGSQSASLVQYSFATDTLTTVGTVSTSGLDLTGIGASAYVPRNSNIFSFWNDPSDGLTKLVYISKLTAEGVPVGQDLGAGLVTSAVAAPPTPLAQPASGQLTPISDLTQYEVYAVQETPKLDFTISNGEVVPNEEFAVMITVLGAAISYGSYYDQPVSVQIQVGTDTFEPWGAYNQPVDGNINEVANDDVNNPSGVNPRSFVLPSTYTPGTPITVVGQSWLKNSTSDSGHVNSHWYSQRIVDSNTNTPQLITLRDGDPVPSITPFLSQPSAVDFIQDYIDFTSNTMSLGPNQAIYLYELGTTNLTSSAADFQDLVVLVSIEKQPGDFGLTSTSGNLSGQISINPNNSPTGEFVLIKSDGTTITRDDLHQTTPVDGSGTFFQGATNYIRIKPKGNGTQNTLLVDGVAYTFENKNTYSIYFGGTTRVYNDNIDSGGLAMGHWWVEFTPGPGDMLDDAGELSVVANLIQVDPKTGSTQPIMQLQRAYDGLAALSAQAFYATLDDSLYLIDATTQTEALVGVLPTSSDMTALEFAGTDLYRFSSTIDQLRKLDAVTPQLLGSEINLGATDLGTVIFVRLEDEPPPSVNYD